MDSDKKTLLDCFGDKSEISYSQSNDPVTNLNIATGYNDHEKPKHMAMDVKFMSNKKIQKLIANKGFGSVAIFLMIKALLYKNNGSITCDKELIDNISDYSLLSTEEVKSMINEMVACRLFNEAMYKNDVLTIDGIQSEMKFSSKIFKGL